MIKNYINKWQMQFIYFAANDKLSCWICKFYNLLLLFIIYLHCVML